MTSGRETGPELLAQAAVGQVAMLTFEGGFGDAGQEQALEMANAIGAAPHIAAGFVAGKDWAGKDDGSIDGVAVRDNVMEMFYDDAFAKMQEGFAAETEAETAEAERVHRDAV
ncbi:MAG: hypothetical protein J6T17_04140, partial [Clostridia bacterium]|nr:hypothetical protein [Clostridia bacterium]